MTRIQDTVEAVAAAIIEQKDYLTALDAEIGDGDHGLNMARGFEAVREAMDEMGDESRPGPVFKAIGEALLENVGGAAGQDLHLPGVQRVPGLVLDLAIGAPVLRNGPVGGGAGGRGVEHVLEIRHGEPPVAPLLGLGPVTI